MKERLLIAILGCVVPLLVMELIARYALGKYYAPTFQTYLVYDRLLGWRPRPNFQCVITSRAKGFSFKVTIGPQGYRKDDGMQGCSNDVPDIVILGDSNAFGFSLNPEDTLAAALAHRLRERGIKSASVLNAACPGYDIVQPTLRVRKMPRQKGQTFIFLVYPVNDLVNTANSIDYHAFKPFMASGPRGVGVVAPPMGMPAEDYRFSPAFEDLNEVFGLVRKRSGVLSFLQRLSALAFSLRYIHSLAWFGVTSSSPEIVWDDMPTDEFVWQCLAAVSNAPLQTAARFWPEIQELQGRRDHLISMVAEMYANLNEMLEREGCHMFVVLAPEPHRAMAFYREQTNLLQSLLPQFTFHWGSSRDALRQELEKRNIPTLCLDSEEMEADKMFVSFDGHTSREGFELMARAIVDEYGTRLP